MLVSRNVCEIYPSQGSWQQQFTALQFSTILEMMIERTSLLPALCATWEDISTPNELGISHFMPTPTTLMLVSLHPLSLTVRPWKMVVGRLLSYWEGNFSRVNSLLNFRDVSYPIRRSRMFGDLATSEQWHNEVRNLLMIQMIDHHDELLRSAYVSLLNGWTLSVLVSLHSKWVNHISYSVSIYIYCIFDVYLQKSYPNLKSIY